MKKSIIWFYMLTKRLLRRYSFWVLLLLIPLLLPAANAAMQNDGGVLRIALCSAGTENPMADAIIEDLMQEDSILRYEVYPSEGAARQAVKENRADAAWIFAADFENVIRQYTAKETRKVPVTVLERETSIPLQLSHEKLYGAVFPHIAFSAYDVFVRAEFSADTEAARYYTETTGGDSIIKMEKLHAEEGSTAGNYLTAPLRGLLSLLVMLCGMAAVMYFLEDTAAGRFDWLPKNKRIFPALGTCLAALLMAGTTMEAALFAAGTATTLLRETAAMFLFALSAAGFCLVLSQVFRKAGSLGAFLPFFILTMLALCPIFFNMKILRPIRLLLPPYYYLQAVYNAAYLFYMGIYILCAFGFAGLLNCLQRRR